MTQPWDGLAPAFEWRKSQRHLLGLCGHVTDRRWHVCAPPGAGKTLVGLELARWHGTRTLVLSPTTAIRDQWRGAVASFGAPPRFATTDLDRSAQLYSITYQLLGNPGAAADDLHAAARRLWLAEVTDKVGEDAARDRIDAVERRDPAQARKELGRHVRVLRRSLATGEDVGVPAERLLGARASAVVERIAGLGVGCVVLDECHHLLDWWALVVNALVTRLAADRDVAVIGLTATLPEPGSVQEGLNYTGLLGEVDAELHLAAMVAEGGVAPWRDGVRVAELAPEETTFLDTWASSFAGRLDDHLVGEPFIEWAVARVESEEDGWERLADADPLVAEALARWFVARGMDAEATGELTLDDRILLLDAWLHDPLDETPKDVRDEVKQVLRRHGVALSASGVRWTRSVADIVCSRSTAKGSAAGEILRHEEAQRGDDLCALVVVERDRATSPPAAARAALGGDAGTDAGTAARVLAAVCAEGAVAARGVLCVTGSGAWCDALTADRVAHAVNVAATDGRWISTRGSDIPSVVELVGHGPSWGTARWLSAAAAALTDGAAHTLVATRGLVGEGWNFPRLNVLVDLSEVASTTAMTQLRGRALRIDPERPDKVASLWDVVIAHPTAHGDWRRFRRRHARWWGPARDGTLVTGAAKVHPRAGDPAPPAPGEHAALNAESAGLMADRAATRRMWAGVDAAGVATSVVHVAGRRVRRQVRTRGRRWRTVGATTGAVAGAVAGAGAVAAGWPVVAVLAVVCGAGVLPPVLLARGRMRSREGFLRLLGEAVAAGLAAAGHPELTAARVTTHATADGTSTTIDGVDDDAATLWADAFEEVMGPLGTPRWLLVNGEHTWRVPRVLGATRDRVAPFAAAVANVLPGTALLHAGSPEAAERTVAAARTRPDDTHRTLRWT
ncbi:DEAD/DEAH box helicase family protein [Actinophytocola algeriensis]|uniref:Helicase ATP-binding domain-containing protein n=1 Tax=Actinophytocola algeriensis TaxID=1768010 RepID=A0A7W7Q733_9PSEU|nr:DEAD/DEAH box helicase family protein [Actinophytocola algeriensis]MBB4908245.1 hypothetical protein [Actinophytocola algeriensis]MBE1480275.1 hypothetical protein [Actinophytocola algeriensis]